MNFAASFGVVLNDFRHKKARCLPRAGVVEWPRDDDRELARINCDNFFSSVLAHRVMCLWRERAVFSYRELGGVGNRIDLRTAGYDNDRRFDLCNAKSSQQVGCPDDIGRVHLTDLAVGRRGYSGEMHDRTRADLHQRGRYRVEITEVDVERTWIVDMT